MLMKYGPKLISKLDQPIPLVIARQPGIATFSVMERLTKKRATHPNGCGGRGTITLSDSLDIPEHDFFKPGRKFDLLLRHATVSGDDQAGLYLRSVSIRLMEKGSDKPLLDLLMNSGVENGFNTVNGFNLLLLSRSLYFYDEVKSDQFYGEVYPRGLEIARASKRRAPDTFAQIYYHAKVTFCFIGKDGVKRFCRYRIIPGDKGAETGLIGRDKLQPDRLPGETRPKDYLTQEYKSRLAKGSVGYYLQIQLTDFEDSYNPAACDAWTSWDQSTSPWHDLGFISINQFLDQEYFRNVYYNLSNHPDSLPLPTAAYSDQYNSVIAMRAYAYGKISSNRRIK